MPTDRLLLNKNTKPAQAVDLMMARAKSINILINKVNKFL